MARPRKIHTVDRDVAPEELGARRPIHVVLDNLRSAYNVGSLFRTGDACLVERLHLCGITAKPPNDKLTKTALGTLDYVPWTYHERTLPAVLALRQADVPVLAVEVTDTAIPLWEVEFPQPVALVVGHEVDGVNDEVLAACDACVSIPQWGLKCSLNVASAAAVVLYEVTRQFELGRPAG